MRPKRHRAESGFTLLEALVALTIVLAFAGAIGPLLFQARRMVAGADNRIAAGVLLRSLLTEPLDRNAVATLSQDGESGGLHWHMSAQPASADISYAPTLRTQASAGAAPAGAAPASAELWAPYRIIARVDWAPGSYLEGDTLRLARAE